MEVKWNKCTEILPDCDNEYLVVLHFFDMYAIRVIRFSTNLHKLDRYAFKNERRSGWVEYDDEYGWFERPDVTHWAELPALPDD